MGLLVKVLDMLGRSLEFALTGEADFRVTTAPVRPSPVVERPGQARLVLGEVLEELDRRFGLRLRSPVFLELERPPAWGWKGARLGREAYLGRYHAQEIGGDPYHRIMVAPGLERGRFRGVLAHELAHAWQRENGCPSSHALREGMARWVEYHVLRRAGRQRDARQLLGIRYYLFGRALKPILEHERTHGIPATLEWLKAR